MRRLKHGKPIANISARSNSQPANLRRRRVRNVVAIQIRRSQHAIVLRPQNNLLKDRIRNPVIHQNLLLPLPIRRATHRSPPATAFTSATTSRANSFEANSIPGSISAAFSSGVSFGFASTIAQNPALALRHRLLAKLLRSNLISPLAERALSELLNVSLVHERHRLAPIDPAHTESPLAPAASTQ